MADICTLVATGRLKDTPDVRGTDEKPFVTFSIACNVYSRKSTSSDPTWINCAAGGGLAEMMARNEHYTRGRRLLVRGDLRQRKWETKDGGIRQGQTLWLTHVPEFLDFPGKEEEPAPDFPPEFGDVEVPDISF